MLKFLKRPIFTLIMLFLAAACAPGTEAAEMKSPASLKSGQPSSEKCKNIKTRLEYEGRFSLIDIGDSTGRHGIYNILWADFLKKNDRASSEIFIRSRVQNFEGDSYIKQYNGMPEINSITLNEAYIHKRNNASELQFGLFHFNRRPPRDLDLREITFEFDPVNDNYDKKGRGNFYYSRSAVHNGAEFFMDYAFSTDYSNSMKIAGARWSGFEALYAFNETRKIYYADYEKKLNKRFSLFSNIRRNEFIYLQPFDQYSIGGKAVINEGKKDANACYVPAAVNFNFLRNKTANNYFLLKRNLSDLELSAVLFPYQRDIVSLGADFIFRVPRALSVNLTCYASIAPLFGAGDAIEAGIPKTKGIRLMAGYDYNDFKIEAAMLRAMDPDDSETFAEKSNLTVKIKYPF